jgi:hypothetical protein
MNTATGACLMGLCYSPIACHAFGFCRERNFRQDAATPGAGLDAALVTEMAHVLRGTKADLGNEGACSLRLVEARYRSKDVDRLVQQAIERARVDSANAPDMPDVA